MRGFFGGSLVLIVAYVLLQPGSADKADQGSGLLVAGARRLLSGDVAGLPQVKGGAAAAGSSSSPSTGGSSGVGGIGGAIQHGGDVIGGFFPPIGIPAI